VGLSLYRAFGHHPELKFSDQFYIKPPNDLYLGKKKVAGLLIEVVSQGPDHHQVIIGLGLNLFSHPHIHQSGSLKDFSDPNAPGQLWESYWQNSLTKFKQGCKEALEQGPSLTHDEVQSLTHIVKSGSTNGLHPYTAIDSYGNLKTIQGENKPWWEL
jgi:BirA family biotin operon repressor/biotin-[acetyl-CoA-carboxylase] ligase